MTTANSDAISPGSQNPSNVRLAGAGRIFFVLGVAVLLAFIGYFTRGILIPIIVAGFASFLIFTLKSTIAKIPLVGRFLPGWISYVLAFAVIASVTILFIEIIRNNLENLIADWSQYESRLKSISSEGVSFLDRQGMLPEDFVGGMEELRSTGLRVINPILRELGASVQSLTSNLVTIFLYTVFMLLERARFSRKINLLSTDEKRRDAVNETIAEITTMVRQYITMKTLTNLVTASISYIIMRLVGVDFPGFWALLIFILNYIPIVGAISAITLPVLLALVQPNGGGIEKAALTLALLVGAEQTMSSVIEPRLIGRSLNLSPLIILVSLAVWGTLWGFAGALLAVPITVTTMIILTQFEATRPLAILLSENGEIAPIRHKPISGLEKGR